MGEARQRKLAREAGKPWDRDKPVEFKFQFRDEEETEPAPRDSGTANESVAANSKEKGPNE